MTHVRQRNPSRFSSFRSVGRSGEPYPKWITDLRGQSGVYAIKCRGVLVYIGESHTDRLYQTMTRHFQRWDIDAAQTYTRGDCEAAVTITSRAEAPPLQAHRIAEMQPRDNTYETEADDATPF